MTIPESELREMEARAEKATKPIPGYGGYEAGSDGSIWSVASDWRGYGRRELAQSPDPHGYLKVRLYRDGKRIHKQTHLLVCLAWHGERPGVCHEVRHLDGSRTNNTPSNLAWGTRSENALDRQVHGTERAAENGRSSAHKLRRTHCRRGHPYARRDARGHGRCLLCDQIYKAKARAALGRQE